MHDAISRSVPSQQLNVQGHRKRWTGFSESTIAGVVCLDVLEQYVFLQIETFEIVSRVIFMQDGAPPHFSCFVTDDLNERFPDAWIGRGGPILATSKPRSLSA